MDIKTSAAPLSRPRLIIDERAYPRLLALAERARVQAPELADRLIEEIERAELRPTNEMPEDVVTAANATQAGIVDGSAPVFAGPIRNQAGEEKAAEGSTLDDAALLSMDWYVEGVQS